MAPGICLSYDPHRRQRGKGIPTTEMPITFSCIKSQSDHALDYPNDTELWHTRK